MEEYHCDSYVQVRSRYVIDRLRKFVERSGYPITDFTYFRKLGPPVFTEKMFRPQRGSEIFVSGLPRDSLEDEIFDFFSEAGMIFDIRLIVMDMGNYNRGQAFVRFFNQDNAKKAIVALCQKPFRCLYKLNIQKSMENNRLYMCGVPNSKTKIDIWYELITRGVEGIKDVILYKSYSDYKRNRGFVFVEFETHEIASKMRHKYNKIEPLYLFGKSIMVDWTITTMEVDQNVMAQVKRLFLRNLPIKMNRKQLYSILERLMETSKLEKVYKTRDYAFIHFTERAAAERALSKLLIYFKGTDVEVTWSIPPEEVQKTGILNVQQNRVLQNLHGHMNVNNSLRPSSINNNIFHMVRDDRLIAPISQWPLTSSVVNEEASPFRYPTWWDLLDTFFQSNSEGDSGHSSLINSPNLIY